MNWRQRTKTAVRSDRMIVLCPDNPRDFNDYQWIRPEKKKLNSLSPAVKVNLEGLVLV